MTAETKDKTKRKNLVKFIVPGAVVLAILIGVIVYLNSDSYHYRIIFRNGQEAYENGEYEQAEEFFLEAVKYGDTEEVDSALLENYIAWGDAEFKAGKEEEACAHFLSALDESLEYVLNKKSLAAIAESFTARADVYLDADDPLNAVTVLMRGEDLTQNEFLTAKLEEKRQEIADNTVIVKVSRYYEDGSLPMRYEYSYDASGNQLTHSEYNGDGSLHIRAEKSYDASGNTLTYSVYYGNGSLAWRYEYSYDYFGNKLTESSYEQGDGSYYQYEYIYHYLRK